MTIQDVMVMASNIGGTKVTSAKRTASKPSKSVDRAAIAAPQGISVDEIATVVSRNVKHLRLRRNLSLDSLAKLSGVSRGMLSQIELGRSVPTIALLWKVSQALAVPFAALTTDAASGGTVVIPAAKAKLLSSAEGSFTSRALFPFDAERRVEFYTLTLAPLAEEIAEAHAPGTTENLTVASGQIEIVADGISYRLQPDDAILFQADVPHRYRNLGSKTAVMYLVMTYADTVGR